MVIRTRQSIWRLELLLAKTHSCCNMSEELPTNDGNIRTGVNCPLTGTPSISNTTHCEWLLASLTWTLLTTPPSLSEFDGLPSTIEEVNVMSSVCPILVWAGSPLPAPPQPQLSFPLWTPPSKVVGAATCVTAAITLVTGRGRWFVLDDIGSSSRSGWSCRVDCNSTQCVSR